MEVKTMTLAKRICEWWEDFAPYEEPASVRFISKQIKEDKPGLISFLNELYEEMSVDNEDDERSFKELGSILEELNKI